MATATQHKMSVLDSIENGLTHNNKFESLLPTVYRSAADRWIKRAKLYISTCKNSAKLQACTIKSLVAAILQGAEQGLPVDGKLAYLVPYGTEATFMASYMGLLAVARRHALIVDGYARILFENDEFSLSMRDGLFSVEYRPYIGADRGSIIGVFAVLMFAGNRVVADFMNGDEIEAVRHRSKAANSGPWVTDWQEMAKKTVIRRTIKTYVDDPEVISLLDADDRDHGVIDGEAIEVVEPRKVGVTRAAPLAIGKRETPDETQEVPNEPEVQHEPAPPTLAELFGKRNNLGGCDDLAQEILADPECPHSVEAVEVARDIRKAELKKK